MGAHGDTIPAMKAVKIKAQGDGRKPIPHVITAVVSIAVSLVATHYVVHGSAGAQGVPGPARSTIIKTDADAGVCAYFGRDATGDVRFQLFEPRIDASGPWCPKGSFVSVTPRK
jgi:hypothetical protein